MKPSLHDGEAAMEPQINVAAMADIVRELISGDQREQRDSAWLRQHSGAAQLNEHEWAALEALRVRVCERGATLLDKITEWYW